MQKNVIIKNATNMVSSLPEDLLTALMKSIPATTTEKAHAYPASLLHTLVKIDEGIITWDRIKNKYARIYINIPWCKSKCIYCRYPESIKIPSENEISVYFADIEREFILYKDRLRTQKIPSETLYIGGGTPSILTAGQIDQLFKIIDSHIMFDVNSHKTFEVSPSTLTKNKMDVLKKHNINRISIGVQALNKDVLKNCLRDEDDYEKVKTAIKLIKEAEIPQLNIDIMLGLPGQTLEIFIDDLYRAIELSPSAISFLDMEVWPGSLLFEKNEHLNPERWKNQLLMTSAYQQIMKKNGFLPRRAHYYVTEKEMKLPNRKAYFDTRIEGFQIGIGARSLSHINNVVYRNVPLGKYHQKMREIKLPIEYGLALNEEQIAAMNATRGLCETGVIPKITREYFKAEIDFLIKNKLLDQNCKFTELGQLLESEIMYLLYPRSKNF